MESVIKALKADRRISVTICEIGAPATEDELDEAREMFGQELPVGVEAFYRQLGSLHLEWEAKDDEDVAGRIHLMPITEVFGDWEGEIWFADVSDEYRLVKPFDCFVPEACAAFHPNAKGDWSVHYHYCGEELESMEIDFPTYIDLLLVSCGYWYWQLALCKEGSSSSEAEEFLVRAPTYLKGFDATLFEDKDVDDLASKRLIKAVDRGSVAGLKKALSEGGDPSSQDDEGNSALTIVATYYRKEKKGLDMTKALLKAGAAVDGTDEDGCQPLFLVSMGAYAGVVKVLLAAGAEIDYIYDERTPLLQAVFWEQEDIALVLLEAGADPALGKIDGGKTVKKIAKKWGNKAVLAALNK